MGPNVFLFNGMTRKTYFQFPNSQEGLRSDSIDCSVNIVDQYFSIERC